MGGSPGIVVIGGDSRERGREFESLDGLDTRWVIFSRADWCLKRPKMNGKEAGDGSFIKKDWFNFGGQVVCA